MSEEIERKFLVDFDSSGVVPKRIFDSKIIKQGYLTSPDADFEVRVRVFPYHDESTNLTIKSKDKNLSRFELEVSVDKEGAEMLLESIDDIIYKRRSMVKHDGLFWEIDTFIKPEFPTLAEVELTNEDQEIEIPSWCSEEVTGDPEYYNRNIAGRVFK